MDQSQNVKCGLKLNHRYFNTITPGKLTERSLIIAELIMSLPHEGPWSVAELIAASAELILYVDTAEIEKIIHEAELPPDGVRESAQSISVFYRSTLILGSNLPFYQLLESIHPRAKDLPVSHLLPFNRESIKQALSRKGLLQ